MRHPFRYYFGRVLRRLLMLLPASMLGTIPQPLLPSAHAQGRPDRLLIGSGSLSQEPSLESEEEPPPAPCIEPSSEVPTSAGQPGTAPPSTLQQVPFSTPVPTKPIAAAWTVAPAATEQRQGNPPSLHKAPTDYRTLGQHRFMPSSSVADPFATTHVGVITGGSYVSSAVLNQDGGKAVYVQDAAFLHGFRFQLGLGSHLAMGAAIHGIANTGISKNALLINGSDLGLIASGHVLGGHTIRNKVRIAGRVEVGYAFNNNINLLKNFELLTSKKYSTQAQFTQELNKLQSNLLQQDRRLLIDSHLITAVGLHSSIGLRFDLALRNVQTIGEIISLPMQLSGAGLVSVDLAKLWPLPIGAQVGYRIELSNLAEAPVASQSAIGGLFYTGRANLALGIDSVITKKSGILEHLEFSTNLIMQYYW